MEMEVLFFGGSLGGHRKVVDVDRAMYNPVEINGEMFYERYIAQSIDHPDAKVVTVMHKDDMPKSEVLAAYGRSLGFKLAN